MMAIQMLSLLDVLQYEEPCRKIKQNMFGAPKSKKYITTGKRDRVNVREATPISDYTCPMLFARLVKLEQTVEKLYCKNSKLSITSVAS